MSSVQNPFLVPLNPGWLIEIRLLDLIPNILGSSSVITYNHEPIEVLHTAPMDSRP